MFITSFWKFIDGILIISPSVPRFLCNSSVFLFLSLFSFSVYVAGRNICHVFSIRIADIQRKILPGVTHWQSPNYFAYYPSNSSIAGFMGEMLSAGLNIVGFSWVTSPAATELEMIVLDWLGKMLKLPEEFLSSGKRSHFFFLLFLHHVRRLKNLYGYIIYDLWKACWVKRRRTRWWSYSRHRKRSCSGCHTSCSR